MNTQTAKTIQLSKLKKGGRGKIATVLHPADNTRFLEMGFLAGETVELVHEAPFGGDPIAIRVRGSLIALRRHEANHIEVEEV